MFAADCGNRAMRRPLGLKPMRVEAYASGYDCALCAALAPSSE
jgi:hypothetical protein